MAGVYTKVQTARLEQTAELPAPPPVKWRELLLVWVVAALVFVALTPHVVYWLSPATGDEPYYLVTAESLLTDHDLDETNNYQQQDYHKFSPSCDAIRQYVIGRFAPDEPGVAAPGMRPCDIEGLYPPLPNHFSKNVVVAGNYTKHGLGLSVLILPAYALGSRFVVVIFMGLLAALLGVNIWLLALETTGRKRVAWIAWGLMLFTVPLLSYAFLIFPATPAALCVVYAFRRIRLAALGQGANGVGRAALVGVCLGFLPWLHSVFVVLVVCLTAYLLLGGRSFGPGLKQWVRRPHRFNPLPPNWSIIGLAVMVAIVAVFAASLAAYYLHFYNSLLPNSQDHAGFVGPDQIGGGILGFLFDQKWGLLMYAPVYLLALSGMALLPFNTRSRQLNRRQRSDLTWLAVVIVPYFLVMSSYEQWWGEWCPPARYLMPIVPLLALPLAVALDRMQSTLFRGVAIGLAIWSYTVAAIFMLNPKVMFNWQSAEPPKISAWVQDHLAFLKEATPANWFPAYAPELSKSVPLLAQIFWLLLAVLIVVELTGYTVGRGQHHRTP